MREDLRGQPVRSLQTMLRTIAGQYRQIPPVVPDGIYGEDTQRSVAALQRYLRLPVTGVADLATWNETVSLYETAEENFAPPQPLEIYLRPGQVLTPGEENLHLLLVDAIFQALALLFENIPPESETGIYRFQELCDLEPTGKLDRPTWRYLTGLYRLAAFDGERPLPIA